jgi:hypothetical protein
VGQHLGVDVVVALRLEFARERSVFMKIVYFVMRHGGFSVQLNIPARLIHRASARRCRMTKAVINFTNSLEVSRG